MIVPAVSQKTCDIFSQVENRNHMSAVSSILHREGRGRGKGEGGGEGGKGRIAGKRQRGEGRGVVILTPTVSFV